MAKRKLPFWMIPAHWGLSGKAKELAKINYYHEGMEADILSADLIYLTEYEIDKAKMEIKKKYNAVTELEYRTGLLDIELKHGKIVKSELDSLVLDIRFEMNDITEKEYDTLKVEIMPDGDEKIRAALEFAYKYHDITDSEYEKEIATLNQEPWMDFNVDFDPETNSVEFSFDYNEYFWRKLKADGHPGNDEQEIIDNYIRDWGRKIAFDDYSDDYDTNLTKANENLDTAGSTLPSGFKEYK